MKDDLNIFDIGLKIDAETLPEVYGLDKELVTKKVKRLFLAAQSTEKLHEVVEMCKAEADSTDESLVLLLLLNELVSEMRSDVIFGTVTSIVSDALKSALKDEVLDISQVAILYSKIILSLKNNTKNEES